MTESQLTDRLTNLTQPTSTASTVTPQYGALFKLVPGLNLYGSYAESFVPGTFLLRNPDGTTSPAAPSRGNGFDVGLKAELLEGRVSGTLSYFDLRNQNIVNDLASTSSSGSVTIYNVQSGEQCSRGVEVDATISATDNWQVYVSYSYLLARITEFSGHDAAILAADPASLDAAGQANYKTVSRFHGAPLQMSAPHLANLWARYDVTQSWARGTYLAAGANLVVDQTLLPDGPDSSHQTYTLVQAMVGYRLPWRGHSVSAELTGKNLLDEHYRPSQSSRGRPREFLLSLKGRF
jgi:iron complex outermembrane receptor protein